MNLVLQHTHIALNKRGRLFSAGGRKKREKAEKLPVSVKKKEEEQKLRSVAKHCECKHHISSADASLAFLKSCKFSNQPFSRSSHRFTPLFKTNPKQTSSSSSSASHTHTHTHTHTVCSSVVSALSQNIKTNSRVLVLSPISRSTRLLITLQQHTHTHTHITITGVVTGRFPVNDVNSLLKAPKWICIVTKISLTKEETTPLM